MVVIGASLALFAWRAPKVGLGGKFDTVSRETALLMNNVLLAVACASVLLGTLYPLLLDALNLGKISVGPPYFDSVFVPIMAPLVFLMGIGPIARWKKGQSCRTRGAATLGARRQPRDRARGSLHCGPLDADDRLRAVARVLGRRVRRGQREGACTSHQGRPVGND